MSYNLGIGSTEPDQQNEASTMMPLDFSLEMDGISGIIPHSAFEIPASTLPNAYLTKNSRKPKIAFILHTIEHNFNNNKWTTKITGQTLNIRFDSLSAGELAARKKAKEQALKDLEAAKKAVGKIKGDFVIPVGCTQQAINLLSKAQVVINIGLIKNSLEKLGITNKNAIASIVAIAGGESGLIPKSEGHVYSLDNLNEVFPGLTDAQATRATKKGISKKDFFTIVYGEYNPKRIGNRNKTDGGLYYGRGFNQLTGHGNYANTDKFLRSKFGVNVDIVKNPEKMNDPEIASKALALYYATLVSGLSQTDPDYFQKALVKTGRDANGGYQKKAEYYACLTSDFKMLI
jgi:predicted chitinase